MVIVMDWMTYDNKRPKPIVPLLDYKKYAPHERFKKILSKRHFPKIDEINEQLEMHYSIHRSKLYDNYEKYRPFPNIILEYSRKRDNSEKYFIFPKTIYDIWEKEEKYFINYEKIKKEIDLFLNEARELYVDAGIIAKTSCLPGTIIVADNGQLPLEDPNRRKNL